MDFENAETNLLIDDRASVIIVFSLLFLYKTMVPTEGELLETLQQ